MNMQSEISYGATMALLALTMTTSWLWMGIGAVFTVHMYRPSILSAMTRRQRLALLLPGPFGYIPAIRTIRTSRPD